MAQGLRPHPLLPVGGPRWQRGRRGVLGQQRGEADRALLVAMSWGIEQYQLGLKQCCGVEKAQVRAARAQRNPIICALHAFLRLGTQRLQTGCNWYEVKRQLLRDAIRT